MSDVILYGFPASTFVNVARLVLAEKGVRYTFCDLEPDMGGPRHLALHPFNRVPILEHDGFRVYETAAIIAYIDEAFGDGPRLTPADAQARARMNQWVHALSSYYYPYIAFHLGHERIVYPALGIASDEKVVAAAMPRISVALSVMEQALREAPFLVGDNPTLADFAHMPCMTTLSLTPEGQDMLARQPAISAWRARMQARPSAQTVLAAVSPHIGKPIEHARNWVRDHRPHYP